MEAKEKLSEDLTVAQNSKTIRENKPNIQLRRPLEYENEKQVKEKADFYTKVI